MRLTRKVFHDLAIWMIAFGLVIGVLFPFFVITRTIPELTSSGIRRLICVSHQFRYPDDTGAYPPITTSPPLRCSPKYFPVMTITS